MNTNRNDGIRTSTLAILPIAAWLCSASAGAQVPRPARMVSLAQANESFDTLSQAANALVGISVVSGDANGALRRWDESWSRTLSELGSSLDASCSSARRSDCEARAISALVCDVVAEVDLARRDALVEDERPYEWPNVARSLSARRRLADAALQRGAAGLSCEDLPGVWTVYSEETAHPVLAAERELIRRARTVSSSPIQAATAGGSTLANTISSEQARTLLWRLYGSVSDLASVMRDLQSMNDETTARGAQLGAGLALMSSLPVAFSRHRSVAAEIRSFDYEACISSDATVRALLCGIGFDLNRTYADFDIAQRATSDVDRDRDKRRAWERLAAVLAARAVRVSTAAIAAGD